MGDDPTLTPHELKVLERLRKTRAAREAAGQKFFMDFRAAILARPRDRRRNMRASISTSLRPGIEAFMEAGRTARIGPKPEGCDLLIDGVAVRYDGGLPPGTIRFED